MKFTALRLAGFKSFVEPAELRIEPGLTGVVGPNGCGKSNLLEAIRWVMGEGSAKSLRSAGMEDVIFAGTASRPARGFAEVVLSAENAAGEPLEVVRRIERGLGSAYRINGRDVRARDVALVFADSATGAHSPALVSQGRIAAVIAARPAERRQMLEEAAGIAGLHVRRREAETRLTATEANLARLEDLAAGLEGQIASLRRQARAAERYRTVGERIRLAEARVCFVRWREADAAASAAAAAAAAAEVQVRRAQDQAGTAQAAQARAAGCQAAARDELADRRDDASAHGHRMATLAAQLEAAEGRAADLAREAARLEAERADAGRLTAAAAGALTRLEAERAAALAAAASEAAREPGLARARELAERDERAGELATAHAAAAQAGTDAEWRIAEAAVAAAEAQINRLAAEAARLDRAVGEVAAVDDHAAQHAAALAAQQAAARRQAEARTQIAEAVTAREAAAATRDAATVALATTRAAHAATAREAEALERDRAARSKLGDAGRSAIAALCVAPGYEAAVAAALGRDAHAPLGDSGGEGRFWAGGGAASPRESALLNHLANCPPELAAMLALVTVRDADDGRSLAPGEALVTMAGDLRRWDGLVARGLAASGAEADAARLQADNRLAVLSARLAVEGAAVREAEVALAAATAAFRNAAAQLHAAEAEANAAATAERVALRAADAADAAVAQLAARREALTCAQAEHATHLAGAHNERDAALAARRGLPDPAAGRAALTAARAGHDAARSALLAAAAALAAHQQALAVARERIAAREADLRSWQARAGDAEARLAGMARREEEIAVEARIVAAKPAGLIAEIEAGEAVRNRLGVEIAEAQTALVTADAAARAAEAGLAAAQEGLATAREARAGASARAENEAARRDELSRAAGERFQCPPPLLPGQCGFAANEVAGADAESAALDRLNGERERLGRVNLVAEQELADLEARAGATTAERAELTEAVHRLRGAIGNLNREGRERLRAAFTAVDGHFQRLFARLFDGGQAHLALVDSDDPLAAGLEIYAQPPGKRIQSLSLLSGGEQALTAVALIFALFLTNPSPICVLDEVDAPLDDANIERFCDLLDAMAGETATRYLIVTHNAVTMSRMHRLFGVTMVEAGVSRLVSVDLGAAEQLLAAE